MCRAIWRRSMPSQPVLGSRGGESIRVLLSADVPQLDVRADGLLWVTDAKGRGQALRARSRSQPLEQGFW